MIVDCLISGKDVHLFGYLVSLHPEGVIVFSGRYHLGQSNFKKHPKQVVPTGENKA